MNDKKKETTEMQSVLDNPHLKGYKVCLKCKKYYDESREHQCFYDPAVKYTAHYNRKRKNKADKYSYVKEGGE